MDIELKKDQAFVGAKAIATRDGAQLTTGVRDYAQVYNCNKGDYTYLTGYYFYYSGLIYAQATNGLFVVNPDNSWDFKAKAIKIPNYSDQTAQKLVNKIIENNYRITRNNLLCARFVNKLSVKEREQVAELQKRVQSRNEALKAEGVTDKIETGYPSGYAELSDDLSALMGSETIGAIASWVIIVVAATIIAGMGTAAYYMYKSLSEESERDVKFSDDLTRTLTSKLTDEEYQQLLDETKGIVTKAKVKQAFGSYWNVIKIAAFAVAGYAGFKFIKNYLQK